MNIMKKVRRATCHLRIPWRWHLMKPTLLRPGAIKYMRKRKNSLLITRESTRNNLKPREGIAMIVVILLKRSSQHPVKKVTLA